MCIVASPQERFPTNTSSYRQSGWEGGKKTSGLLSRVRSVKKKQTRPSSCFPFCLPVGDASCSSKALSCIWLSRSLLPRGVGVFFLTFHRIPRDSHYRRSKLKSHSLRPDLRLPHQFFVCSLCFLGDGRVLGRRSATETTPLAGGAMRGVR